MDNNENNSPLSGERVPNGLGVTLEEIQIIEMAFDAYNADRPVSAGHYEPYVVGFEYGYREAQSRIAELEASNTKYKEALEACYEFIKVLEEKRIVSNWSGKSGIEQILNDEKSI